VYSIFNKPVQSNVIAKMENFIIRLLRAFTNYTSNWGVTGGSFWMALVANGRNTHADHFASSQKLGPNYSSAFSFFSFFRANSLNWALITNQATIFIDPI
jgi:hypothetical protein